jgi:hypothetical protein
VSCDVENNKAIPGYMKLKFLLLTFIGITGCLNSKATETYTGDPGKVINEVAGSVIDADSKKPLKEVLVTAYSVSQKENMYLLMNLAGLISMN